MHAIIKLLPMAGALVLMHGCDAPSNQSETEVAVQIGDGTATIAADPLLSLLEDTAVARISDGSATVFVTLPQSSLTAGPHAIGVGGTDEIILWASLGDGTPLVARSGDLTIVAVDATAGGQVEITLEAKSAEEPTMSVSGKIKGRWD